jgi:hypothetical protein
MKSRILHLQTLIDNGACPEQVKLFLRKFGKSVRVTESLCRRVAPLFHWNGAARYLLSATALKAYDEATAPAWKAYEEACAPAWKAYEEARAPAWKAYDEACATAFARAYINDP